MHSKTRHETDKVGVQVLNTATGHNSLLTLVRFARVNGFYVWLSAPIFFSHFLSKLVNLPSVL